MVATLTFRVFFQGQNEAFREALTHEAIAQTIPRCREGLERHIAGVRSSSLRRNRISPELPVPFPLPSLPT
jgi:hypothetical protein